jgi:putative hydrolase of the HAD superfamily
VNDWIDRGTWPDHQHDADYVVIDVLQATGILEAEVPADPASRS